MSNVAVNWVKQLVVGKATAKYVLRELADAARDAVHVSRATGKSWPPLHAYLSIGALEQITELNRKTVIASLKYLQEKKFIRHAGTDGQSNQVQAYELLVTSPKNGTGEDAELTPPTSPKNGTGSRPKKGTGTENGTGTVFSPDQSRFYVPPVPKTGHETIRNLMEPLLPAPTSRDFLSDIPDELYEDFAKLRKSKKAPITKTAVQGIRREAQKAGISLPAAIEVCCEAGWQSFKADWYAKRMGVNPFELGSSQQRPWEGAR